MSPSVILGSNPFLLGERFLFAFIAVLSLHLLQFFLLEYSNCNTLVIPNKFPLYIYIYIYIYILCMYVPKREEREREREIFFLRFAFFSR
jgi:hypothetical protein